MERYEAAVVELVDIDEDVITASGATNSTSQKEVSQYSCHESGGYVQLRYTDGTIESFGEETDTYSQYCG